MLTTVVSFVVVLGILVFFHELGHYWVARRNGIVVEEFGMGYPPRLVKLFTYDGTDFTINLIPFGGFARMKGEDAGDMTPGSFNAASRLGRAATLLAGPFMNVVLAVIFFAASYMAGFPAPVAHPRVIDVPAGSLAAQIGVQPGDVLLESDGAPVRVSAIRSLNYDVPWEGQSAPGAPSSLAVRRGDSDITLTLPNGESTEDAISTVLNEVDFTRTLYTQIAGVAPNSPAAQAGLEEGDLVYSVDNVLITPTTPLTEVIRDNLDREVTLTVLRNNRWFDVKITPRSAPPEGEGALGVIISDNASLGTMGVLPALWEGVRGVGEYTWTVIEIPLLLISGRPSPVEADLTGPVGIAQLVGDAVSASVDTGLWFPILRLSAVLSAALAVTNLLPLPALDGGRLLFILIEAVRGRRINPEREGIVHMLGFMFLLGLLVLITVRDITTTRESIDWLSIMGQ